MRRSAPRLRCWHFPGPPPPPNDQKTQNQHKTGKATGRRAEHKTLVAEGSTSAACQLGPSCKQPTAQVRRKQLSRVAEAAVMLTQSLLSFISTLDSYGAQTWNLRAVAATSALVLYLTYRIGRSGPGGKKLGNVCWEGFLHAALSGIGSAICVYLNHFAAVEISRPLPWGMACATFSRGWTWDGTF